ncbi:NAD(P)/FAD-dependent oxidoreductase [Hydrogenophaga sp. 5NK40-0174]|uniref:NAD(P)/FAD-dependent oxidoreductase n=1 Tax=Hydrogenophaga sp. 5NK40-0174 TaxID=3127649 RepID=UPI00310706A9
MQVLERVDTVVVGAGAVGLAVARSLALQGLEVMVLESQAAIGQGVSSRNSEVIHAGIYYPLGSKKASLCIRGRHLLYAYCRDRHVPHRRTGKLIVATTGAQQGALSQLQSKGQDNGAEGLVMLTRAQARVLEPELACVAALYSPETGILDAHSFMLALQGDLERDGGQVVCHTRVERLTPDEGRGWVVHTADGTLLGARWVINAAGLGACELAAATEGLHSGRIPQAHFGKGQYFAYPGRSPFSHLIYPVPDPEAPPGWLGVHLTLDMAGQARFGPDMHWTEEPDDLTVDASHAIAFERAVRHYWPGLPQGSLVPAYAGMRPKIHGPGQAAPDFRLDGPAQHGLPGLVNLMGIESPGLTSALAIGERVAAMVAEAA